MSKNVIRLRPDGDPEKGMQPSDMVAQSAFTTDDKHELNWTNYATEDESLLVGVWECAPCREEIKAYPVNEMMTVLSGSVTMTNADGTSDTFTRGDTFFIAKGTQCVWHVTETLRKYYMIAS